MKKVSRLIFIMNQKQLQSLPKKDLIEKCLAKQLDTRGTKYDLVKRLIAASENTIIQSIIHTRPTIIIEENDFHQYVHRETLLVFDPTSQMVVGKKHDFHEEITHPLTYPDIQNCLKFKFRYQLPDNLADGSSSHTSSEAYSHTNYDQTLRRRLLQIRKPDTNDDSEDDDEQEFD
jgi:hypothetical protein